MSYWSVIKYTQKNCEDEFLEHAERLENELEQGTVECLAKTTDGQVVQLICKAHLMQLSKLKMSDLIG